MTAASAAESRWSAQDSTGRYQVSVSKVADALGNARRRAKWLRPADRELASALNGAFSGPKPRQVTIKDSLTATLRFRWDGSTVEIRITGKPKGGASVAVGNMNLEEAAQVESRRIQWRGALESLKQHLSR